MKFKVGDKVKVRNFASEITKSNTYKGVYINSHMKTLMETTGIVKTANVKLVTVEFLSGTFNFPPEALMGEEKVSSDDLLAELAGGSTKKATSPRAYPPFNPKFEVGDFVYVEPTEIRDGDNISGIHIVSPMDGIMDQCCRVRKVSHIYHNGIKVPTYYLTIPEQKDLECFYWPESVLYLDSPDYAFEVGDNVYVNQLITEATENNLKGMEDFAMRKGVITERTALDPDLRIEYTVNIEGKGNGWLILERYLSGGNPPDVNKEIEDQLKTMKMGNFIVESEPEGLHNLEKEMESKAKTDRLENEIERLNSAVYQTAAKIEEVKNNASKTVYAAGNFVKAARDFTCSGATIKQGAVYQISNLSGGRLYLKIHPFYEGFPWQTVHINDSSANTYMQVIPHLEFNDLNVFDVVKLKGKETFTSANPYHKASDIVEKLNMKEFVGKKVRTTSGAQGKITEASYDFIEETPIFRLITTEKLSFMVKADTIIEFITVENIITETEQQFALLNHPKKTSKEELINRYFQ